MFNTFQKVIKNIQKIKNLKWGKIAEKRGYWNNYLIFKKMKIMIDKYGKEVIINL